MVYVCLTHINSSGNQQYESTRIKEDRTKTTKKKIQNKNNKLSIRKKNGFYVYSTSYLKVKKERKKKDGLNGFILLEEDPELCQLSVCNNLHAQQKQRPKARRIEVWKLIRRVFAFDIIRYDSYSINKQPWIFNWTIVDHETQAIFIKWNWKRVTARRHMWRGFFQFANKKKSAWAKLKQKNNKVTDNIDQFNAN